MKKVRLSSMTCKEVAEKFAENPVVLIPNASIEEHGPQTPMGDYRLTDIVSEKIAERTDSVVVPILPYGYSDVYRGFPGCISLDPETLRAVLNDIARSLLEHGLTRLVFVCGHNGNMPIIEQVARDIRHEWGIRVGCIEPLRLFSPQFLAEVYDMPNPPIGHGSDPLTSIALHLYPEDVRLDLAEAGNPREFEGLSLQGLTGVPLGDVVGHIYCDMKEVTPNGVLGDVSIASAEAGKKIIDNIIEKGVEFVEIFKTIDPIID